MNKGIIILSNKMLVKKRKYLSDEKSIIKVKYFYKIDLQQPHFHFNQVPSCKITKM